MLLIIFLAALAASFILTAVMRRYAIAWSLVDIPGIRSSHEVATPRGGGAAVVLTLSIAVVCLAYVNMLDLSVAVSLFGAGLLVATVGFWDDHGHIPARWRLICHFFAAGWGLYWLDGLPPIVLLEDAADLGLLADAVVLVFLVWLLNLYNFMDGINGIASIEAITTVFGGAVIYWIVSNGAVQPLFVAFVGALVGFLVWNFPRARIFMGDACSGFLGLLLGLIAIWQARLVPELFIAWIILLGCFFIDATVTLVRRILRGERFYEAHRSHAYQFASRQLGSHTLVSLAVGAINLIWLLPLALLVALEWVPAIIGLLIAYAPLVLLAFYLRAGAGELQVD